MLAAPPTVSGAPARLASTRSSITLSWLLTADGGSPITGYRLYQTHVRTGEEVLAYDGTGVPTVSSTLVTGLEEGELYQYRVSAINRAGEGAKSPLSPKLLAAEVPARGIIPRRVAFTSDTIELAFTPTSDNGGSPVTAYHLYAAVATASGGASETFIEVATYDGLSMSFVLDKATETW